MNRIFVIRVGADSSHYPIRSPIFKDNRFEFIPIPEGENNKWRKDPIPHIHPMLRYCEIPCFNDPSRNLGEYVGKHAQTVAHNDPEFTGMTYGDLCKRNPRAINLIDDEKGAKLGDFLFFLARLEKHDGSNFVDDAGLYFIGYFHIETVCGPIQTPLADLQETRIGTNAHVLRAKAEPNLWVDERSKFWVFKGGPNSVRFPFALEADWEWLHTIFHDAYGRDWKKNGYTPIQRVASYTRTIRCQLDPDNPEQNDSYQRFWDKVQRNLDKHT